MEQIISVQPKVYFVSDHDINPALLDSDALYVLSKLREAGFTAYLVGGSVRDLLIKKIPKDYDISTSALPEQIKSIFPRNCLLIGRRFRLAHVRFKHKIIEVSTFRSGDNESDLIVRDNQWGTPAQDVLRRDFTVNGLFYDAATHSIIDYVGGWEDIHAGLLRSIGDAETRFKQDPVRMIRLLKFRARFGFKIIPETRQALINCREEIVKSSPARILEEFLRMLESGAASPFFNLLVESGLLSLLNPSLTAFLKGALGKEIYQYLTCADKINQTLVKKPLDRSILMACLLFPILSHRIQTQFLDANHTPHLGEIIMLTTHVINEFEVASFFRFPRRLTAIMNDILSAQYRLTPLSGKRHHNLRVFKSKDFNFSLNFLKIRSLVDKNHVDVYNSWKDFSRQNEKHSRHHPAPHHSHSKEEFSPLSKREPPHDKR